MPTTFDRWILPARDRVADRTAPAQLFCFAHAGGGTALYQPWRSREDLGLEVRPVLLPGRESRIREAPLRQMEELVGPLAAALQSSIDRPFALFGHSLGAIVAFETARRLLEQTGLQPEVLIVSGRRAPHLVRRRARLSHLDTPAFLRALEGLNGTPREVLDEPGLLQLVLPALRADFEVNETYEHLPGPELSCPIAAYMGSDDPEVSGEELLRWHEMTAGRFTLRRFSGDHFYLKAGRSDVVAAVVADVHGLRPVFSSERDH